MLASRVTLEAAASVEPAGLVVRTPILEACRMASLQLGGPRLHMLGVTSAIRGEGRTEIAAAMALVQCADYGRACLLLELDLEHPALASRARIAPWPGVCEVVRGEAPLERALQPLLPGLTALSGGSAAGSAARVVAQLIKSDLLSHLASRYDVVIADLPPALASSFGPSAASAFPDLLLVVRAGTTALAALREAIDSLAVEPRVLLNGTHTALPGWLRRLAGV